MIWDQRWLMQLPFPHILPFHPQPYQILLQQTTNQTLDSDNKQIICYLIFGATTFIFSLILSSPLYLGNSSGLYYSSCRPE